MFAQEAGRTGAGGDAGEGGRKSNGEFELF